MKKAKESDKIVVEKPKNQETFAMKTITEIIGGAQALMDINSRQTHEKSQVRS